MHRKLTSRVEFKFGTALFFASSLACLSATSADAASTCDGIAAWSASTIYVTSGAFVVRNGKEYVSNWWTQGDDPVTNSGGTGAGQPWTLVADCGAAPGPAPAPSPPPPPSPPSTLPTPIHFTPKSTASGVINYHLALPYSSAAVEKLTLSANEGVTE